jgi:radical SAM protein with 4Fe4S-binding SPASM domain
METLGYGNQSEIVYGNILKESVEEIWNKKDIKQFRDLNWAEEPCKDCALLTECTGGCKVDLSCSSTYCIDYHIRENRDDLLSVDRVEELWEEHEKEYQNKVDDIEIPQGYREFFVDRFTKLNNYHNEKYIVTRYQTVVVDNKVYKIMEEIMNGLQKEEAILEKFGNDFETKELRRLLSQLERIEAIRSKQIRSIDWEITRDCNLECKHCITSSPIKVKYRGLGEIIRVINELCDFGLEEVSLTGGEPLKYPHIDELMEYLKYKKLSIRLLTNGTLLTEKNTDFIKQDISEVGVSLDGTTEDTNDYIRGEGSFVHAMRGIELLKKNKIPFSLYFTMHNKNHDIEEMIEFSREIGAEYCKINEITKRGRALENTDLFSNVKYNIPEQKKLSESCDLDKSHLFVNSIGDCFPCVELSQTGKPPLGNVFKNDLLKISERLKSFVNENMGNKCPYTIYCSDQYATICTNNKFKCNTNE